MCETLTDKQLAEQWQVSPRWIADHARDPVDPLPAFKLGRVRRYSWNCPGSELWAKLQAWFERHTNHK